MERVEHGAKSGTIAAMAISAFLSVLILIFGRFIMGIFTSTEELITLSYNMMRILIIGYIAMEVTQCLSGIMRGAGDTTTPMWISMFSSILMRVPMAYIFVYLTKSPDLPQGNCYMMQMSMLVTWTIGAFITYMTYKRGKWKTKAI
jgi:Na+-driven multidrug efflux pump